MSEYIKREDAIRQIVKTSAQNELDIPAIGTVIYILSEMDSADVRENVRGEWIRRDSRYVGWISFDCSVCGETLELDRETSNDFKYCPFCGAEMREVNYELETRTID